MQIYLVTADHVHPDYACKNARAVVKEYAPGLYYAQIDKYGCSKNYSSPERAIAGMLSDHACTNIRIVAEAPAVLETAPEAREFTARSGRIIASLFATIVWRATLAQIRATLPHGVARRNACRDVSTDWLESMATIRANAWRHIGKES